MRLFVMAACAASMLFIGLPIASASAWGYQQVPQQNCHYYGHYDQNGQLHTDGMICDGEGNYPSQQPQYQEQEQEYHPWHPRRNQFGPRTCYDQFDQNWNRFRVCM
jgi:hypothetical protein